MEDAQSLEWRRGAQMRLAELLGCVEGGGSAAWERGAQQEVRCEACGALLGAHEVVYTTQHRWCEVGCWRCCRIDAAGDLVQMDGDVLEYAGYFVVRVQE